MVLLAQPPCGNDSLWYPPPYNTALWHTSRLSHAPLDARQVCCTLLLCTHCCNLLNFFFANTAQWVFRLLHWMGRVLPSPLTNNVATWWRSWFTHTVTYNAGVKAWLSPPRPSTSGCLRTLPWQRTSRKAASSPPCAYGAFPPGYFRLHYHISVYMR